MSTKVYQGYRFPRSRLDEFILIFNEISLRAVSGFLRKHKISESTTNGMRKDLGTASKLSDDDLCLIWQLTEGMLMSKQERNDMFHLDCSFNLWLRGRWAYMIPYMPNFVKVERVIPKWCEFYGYWDNTDPQEGVSPREWSQREKNWNLVALDDWHKTRLTHIAIELKMPHLIGMDALLRRMRRDVDLATSIYMLASSAFWKETERIESRKGKGRRRV